MGTWDGGGTPGGARGNGSGRSGALGSCVGISGIASGASGAWERVRRCGMGGNGRAVGGSVVQGSSRIAAVCESGSLCGASLATQEGVSGNWG